MQNALGGTVLAFLTVLMLAVGHCAYEEVFPWTDLGYAHFVVHGSLADPDSTACKVRFVGQKTAAIERGFGFPSELSWIDLRQQRDGTIARTFTHMTHPLELWSPPVAGQPVIEILESVEVEFRVDFGDGASTYARCVVHPDDHVFLVLREDRSLALDVRPRRWWGGPIPP